MFSGLLATAYPSIQVDSNLLFARDGNIYSSGGITAGIDLALALVEEDLGREIALATARTMVDIFIYFWCFTKSRSRVLIHVIHDTGGTLGGQEYGVSRPCLDHRRSGEPGFRHAREGALSGGTSLFSLETHLCWEENGDRPQDLSLSASCRCAGR
jgi:hypothetical protein